MKTTLNSGRQTTLDQFLKPLNLHNASDETDGFSDEEESSSSSSSNDPSYEPEVTFRMSPRTHQKKRARKSSTDEALSKKVIKGNAASRTLKEDFTAVHDTKCCEDENKMTQKNEKAVDNSRNLLDNALLVTNSPSSDPETSLPVIGSTLEISSDSNACTSSTFTSLSCASDLVDANSSKPVTGKRSSHHAVRRRRSLKCIRSSRKKRVQKGSRKDDPSLESQTLPRIHAVTIGDYELEPPYTSPLPLELVKRGHIYICEKCLEFKESKETLERHTSKCWLDYPPGDEIFRQDNISVFEVDGNISKMYCQNLCLLAKFFIDHKTLFYDVEPFLFYVLTVFDSAGCHLAGYFSKQKCSAMNNLSCILTLPSYQSKGYGRFLIDFSYLLSRREETTGTPERPLSDLGTLAYRSYWRSAVLEFFKRPSYSMCAVLTLEDVAKTTGIAVEDIIETMKDLDMFQCDQKGNVKSLVINTDLVELHWAGAENDTKRIWIDEDNLKWEPKAYTVADFYSADEISDV